ncbi:hypothetical protein [Pseudomonas alvandae]|uniref:hypothetical protein n=1 Tax=Pseudomonas canavaninivorans TaxID=2842348 RepID=UPI003D65B092
MTEVDDSNLADGSARDFDLVHRTLKAERWRADWQRRVTILTVCVVVVFYVALLGFVFFGNGRITVGENYWFLSLRPHTTADIPIVVSLAAVPTILLVALLRFFNHRAKEPEDEFGTTGSASLDLAKELVKSAVELTKSK